MQCRSSLLDQFPSNDLQRHNRARERTDVVCMEREIENCPLCKEVKERRERDVSKVLGLGERAREKQVTVLRRRRVKKENYQLTNN